MPFTRCGRAAVPVLLVILAACSSVGLEKSLETLIAEAEAGRPGAVKALILRFGHPNPDEAQRAWQAVVDIGDTATDELIRALESDDPGVSEHAAGALGANRAGRAVESLIRALQREDFRRYVAAWALGEIGDPRAVEPLVGALGDRDGEVRKYATRSLVKFGPESVPALLEGLGSDSPWIRRYAVRALGEIRDPRAAGPLLEIKGKVDREVYLWALGRTGDPRGYPVLAEAAGDPDWKIRLAAVQALGDLADRRAVQPLLLSLEDEEWIIREWSARGLESVTGERYTYRDQRGENVYPYNLYR